MSDGTLEDAETIDIVVGTTNRAPVATAQSVTTAEDSATAITLAGTDPDGDSLTFTVVSQPAHGTLSGTAPALTYTPDPDYAGPDSFTFTVSDGDLTSAPATVSITVTPVDDAPSFDQDLGAQTNAEGDLVSLDAGASDRRDELTYAASGLPAGLSIDPASGLISGAASPPPGPARTASRSPSATARPSTPPTRSAGPSATRTAPRLRPGPGRADERRG